MNTPIPRRSGSSTVNAERRPFNEGPMSHRPQPDTYHPLIDVSSVPDGPGTVPPVLGASLENPRLDCFSISSSVLIDLASLGAATETSPASIAFSTAVTPSSDESVTSTESDLTSTCCSTHQSICQASGPTSLVASEHSCDKVRDTGTANGSIKPLNGVGCRANEVASCSNQAFSRCPSTFGERLDTGTNAVHAWHDFAKEDHSPGERAPGSTSWELLPEPRAVARPSTSSTQKRRHRPFQNPQGHRYLRLFEDRKWHEHIDDDEGEEVVRSGPTSRPLS